MNSVTTTNSNGTLISFNGGKSVTFDPTVKQSTPTEEEILEEENKALQKKIDELEKELADLRKILDD